MAKSLIITHEDDAFFEKGVEALASNSHLQDDASAEEKMEAARKEIRLFLREAVKQYELRKFQEEKRRERSLLASELELSLDAQAGNLTITIRQE